jgi:8-oxo-dGTP pyrophosphatase MutT (NUDIX family)
MPISPYVAALRRKIGTDLLMLPSVTVMLFDENGRVLLAQHPEGRWITIGGAIDPGETPAEAAIRECREETGLIVEPVRLIGVFGGADFHVTYGNGDEVQYTTILFEARLLGGEAKPDGIETVALRYVSEEELPSLPTAPSTRAMLAMAYDREGQPHFGIPSP